MSSNNPFITVTKSLKNIPLFLCVLLMTSGLVLEAQDVQNSRRMSHKMEIARVVGTTKISMTYHSPKVQGRKIFGGIVPYDFVVDNKEYPWRAGSNNRTIIEFEHNVTINGQELPAGKYGLLVLVNEKEWTFIFSTDYSWGAFNYNPENNVLRIKAKVKNRVFQEWLSYDFVDPNPESAGIELRWENVSAGFTVGLDVSENILADLRDKEDKTARDYRVMAIETMKKDPGKLEEALMYLEKALSKVHTLEGDYKQAETFFINILKSDYLISKGAIEEGKSLKQETIKSSQGFNMYYYALNTLIVKGDREEAFKLLTANMETNPKQWQAYLAMGEYYLKANNQKKVVENFKRAYELAPDPSKNYTRYLYLQNKLILERSAP
ncbi:DUF2911 domain-containing protein [Seonamhaeicola sp.]|uniref:DUF2911 domain-containing protein n=1 Tax=Seonamhaeicola sp. TaxID=1912245 RepID=UPI002612059C|nr:DUF2911 domain-containing protein [Seonamhaeicola sp.]